MQKKRPYTSKTQGKNRNTTPPLRLPFWPLRLFLGLVLIVAGAMKLYEMTFETREDNISTLLLMVFAEAEVLGGLWLLAGFNPERTRWWAAAAFTGFATSSLCQGLAGKCSCGCFGSLSVNPWFVFLFDITAVAALIGSSLSKPADAPNFKQPLRLVALVSFALIIGIVGWQQPDQVTVTGIVTASDLPLKDAVVMFTGASGEVVLHTDQDGNFQLRHVRPGLYAVSAPGRVFNSMKKAAQPIGKPKTRIPTFRLNAPTTEHMQTRESLLLWIDIPTCSTNVFTIAF